jgi:hypothetical protein
LAGRCPTSPAIGDLGVVMPQWSVGEIPRSGTRGSENLIKRIILKFCWEGSARKRRSELVMFSSRLSFKGHDEVAAIRFSFPSYQISVDNRGRVREYWIGGLTSEALERRDKA